ncbi:MAG: polysaccharide biosynthesis/export family protein [Gammaproteobacteria bacterium]|nr:polysaccharide biosynthesis/export family protein [Gammaproteobacteria bacterium]
MKKTLYILTLFLVINVNCVFAETVNYYLQPGDVLSVSVWKEEDLQQLLLVRPDGGISFPLVGDIQASGNTIEGIRQIITRKLSKLIPDVQVSVALQELNGNLIYVVGKVNRPGVFPFSKNVDVLQALGMAGGATAFAALNDIKVLRREAGQLKSIKFRYADIEKGRDLQQNIILQSGDTVLVP